MPGRNCTVCDHAERQAIDAALIAGASNRRISAQYQLVETSVRRHRDNHIPTEPMRAAVQAAAVVEAEHGIGLAASVSSLRADALRLLAKAEAAGDLRTALAGVREAARCVELMAKLSGDIDASTTVNVAVMPAFITVQTAILAALAPYPDARRAVVQALEGVP